VTFSTILRRIACMDPQEFREACDEFVSEIQAEVEPLRRVRELPRHDPRRNWILHRLPFEQGRREAVRLLARRPRPRERSVGPRSRERTARSGRDPPGDDDPHLAPSSCPVSGSLSCDRSAAT
jgi:hypothetical protein